jgi:hypothetical protein
MGAPGPLLLPARVRRRGEALMHQQCWCWGQDIRRDQGNLLLAFGFSRVRSADPRPGSSRYTVTLAPGRRIAVWGWGLLVADIDLGAALIGRYAFGPRYSRNWRVGRQAHTPADVSSLAVPWGPDEWRRAGALLGIALSWTASYERWVTATAGAEYRDRVLTAWGHGRDRAATLPGAWRRLAFECDAVVQRGLARAAGLPPACRSTLSRFDLASTQP